MMATPVVRWRRHWLVTDCWRLCRARPPTMTSRPGMVWRTRNLEVGWHCLWWIEKVSQEMVTTVRLATITNPDI